MPCKTGLTNPAHARAVSSPNVFASNIRSQAYSLRPGGLHPRFGSSGLHLLFVGLNTHNITNTAGYILFRLCLYFTALLFKLQVLFSGNM